MKQRNTIIGVIIALVIVSIGVFGVLFITRNLGKTDKLVNAEQASAQLTDMVASINPSTGKPVSSAVEYADSDDTTAEELPELDTNKITAEATTDTFAEIWCSPEKAGEGTDGWMRELAEQYNKQGITIDGQKVSVRIRTMSSGLGVDYITTGKATPAAFSPSSKLWVGLLSAKGVKTEYVRERTVGNVAGVLLDKDNYNKIIDTYGTADLKAITEATGKGELSMGYTNPFTSTTGLNFLISTLLRYDSSDPLSSKASTGFRQFQSNVPFVALTTVQMRDAAARGSLDGFVLEYQLYQNDPSLSSNYKFVPFGYRHDNPLIKLSSTPDMQAKILESFAQYCDESGADLAKRYGFNGMDDYKSEIPDVSGEVLVSAQKLYKENKDNGKEVIAVFVADVSGSMGGEPLNALQESLVNSMRYIKETNYVGLVSYSDDVCIELPVGQFDLKQQSLFKGAVENLRAAGGTATFDGIVVAADMVQAALADHPDAKPMVFVLSDGETNQGYTLADTKDILTSLRIPVYTIGYNADIDALKKISGINEAASIDASTDDVVYQLKQLFNANM